MILEQILLNSKLLTVSLLTTFNAKKAEYQIKNTNENESQQEMLRKLQLSENDHYELIKHCEHKK